jgi:hypothetical protein
VPQRRGNGGDGAALRAYLLAEAKSMLAFFLGHPWPLGGHAEYEPTTREIAENALGGSVQQIASGAAYRLRRNDLPDWHPERFAVGVNDWFELGADDVLRRL